MPAPRRVREASSRPRREYKPKPREPYDLGEPEQSNGGFPCAPAPKATGIGRDTGVAKASMLRGGLWARSLRSAASVLITSSSVVIVFPIF